MSSNVEDAIMAAAACTVGDSEIILYSPFILKSSRGMFSQQSAETRLIFRISNEVTFDILTELSKNDSGVDEYAAFYAG
ncbi:unnamed protein product [Acanthoscelides obtectus]|uniref:Uncharacterized protein n=1 Tax=Acanthoscelides obtectus TaxID=200917 RepID=A0A9P0MF01_ACAOB|nr:unnamed protein product [Acanthoscelides obtectus]CAK1626679.1 hypothetical protein AOBTE_LOCUS4028 [Acanthoscelides obtectus]